MFNNTRAQSGLEAMFAISTLIVMFGFVAGFVYSQTTANAELDESLKVLNSCWRFANTADSVFASSDGTEINATFVNVNFTLFPASRFVRADSEAFEQTEFCTTRSNRFSSSKTQVVNFTLKSGAIVFKKDGSMVVVKNV